MKVFNFKKFVIARHDELVDLLRSVFKLVRSILENPEIYRNEQVAPEVDDKTLETWTEDLLSALDDVDKEATAMETTDVTPSSLFSIPTVRECFHMYLILLPC